MIANAGCANSSSDRSPGSTGAFLAATSEGGANRSRDARLGRLAAGWAGVVAARPEAADACAAEAACAAGRRLRPWRVRRPGQAARPGVLPRGGRG